LANGPNVGYFSPDKEAKRQTVNNWIRTSKAFDAIVDFDAFLADSAHPAAIASAFDSGDHLHPNDAGYRAMADAIDLKLFQRSSRQSTSCTATQKGLSGKCWILL
jgi:lysophospholipase L1-like esterase